MQVKGPDLKLHQLHSKSALQVYKVAPTKLKPEMVIDLNTNNLIYHKDLSLWRDIHQDSQRKVLSYHRENISLIFSKK